MSEKYLNKIKNSNLIFPIQISQDSPNKPKEQIINSNKPIFFKPIFLKNSTSIAIPIFTNEIEFKKSNLNTQAIILSCEDVSNYLFNLKNKVDLVLIDNNKIDFNAFLDLFKVERYNKSKEQMVNLLKENSITLTEDMQFYLREECDYMNQRAKDNIFSIDFPFNVSSDINFRFNWKYLNIINVPKGFKIFNSGKYVDKTTHYDIVLAPDCEYELIDKLDEYTFIWECISQRFYE